ncbi:gamma-glutamylcyclotransferase [Halalkalibacillus sediminis]|uniref:gamma-glutamylcyclotransferase n=1 Tax=Halalkalibacillus sediminis TaxID=2018042 RepID=UPI0013902EE2|nr:gamma-glutamylcyclotransferase family protein [Halalkalibacillus sediminis]
MITNYLFVYGTLQKHERNHHWLNGAERVAEQAWTKGRLVESEHEYPGLVRSDDAIVYGELYKIDEDILKKVDELESFKEDNEGNFFDREIRVVDTDGSKYEAHVYFLNQPNVEADEQAYYDWKVTRRLQKETPLYFAYGSCMDHERIEVADMLDGFDAVGLGVLSGYDMDFTTRAEDGGRADITEKKDSTVEGIVYKITDEALEYLYMREGVYAGKYRPAFVDVEVEGKKVNMLTFIVIDKEESIAPPDHYLTEIVRGGKKFLTEKYINAIHDKVDKLRKG